MNIRILLISLCVIPSFICYGQVVSTKAGNGSAGYANGQGTSAQFDGTGLMAHDAEGNVYISDVFNHIIRKVDTAGNVSTYAGTQGVSGSANGSIGSCSFNQPYGLAFDSEGDLYVADDNHKIRVIDIAAGTISDFAGSGSQGSSDGNGTSASFNHPTGIAFDSDDTLYVADRFNHAIRKIAPNGDVTTLAGGSQGFSDGSGTNASFNFPVSIYYAPNDSLIVCDRENHALRMMSTSGVVTTWTGTGISGNSNGSLSQATYSKPHGIVADDQGNYYIADRLNHLIRKVDMNGNVTTFAGSGTQGYSDDALEDAEFSNPSYMLFNSVSSELWISDLGNNTIRSIEVEPIVSTEFIRVGPAALNIYPNPTSGNVRLNVEINPTNPLRVEVLDQMGRSICLLPLEQGRSGNGTLEFDIPNSIEPGTYFIRVEADNYRAVTPVIKL